MVHCVMVGSSNRVLVPVLCEMSLSCNFNPIRKFTASSTSHSLNPIFVPWTKYYMMDWVLVRGLEDLS